MRLLQYKEWEGTNSWYCNDTTDLNSIASMWWLPARFLNISPAQFVELLIIKFNPDFIQFDGKTLIYSWKQQKDEAKFRNWINTEAKKKGFTIWT